jgi:hypothetical protein
MLVGVVILNWSITLFGPASVYWPVALLVVLSGFWGMTVAVISWLDLDDYPGLERWRGAFGWANALLVVVLMGVWAYIQFHNAPAYTTDELSFDQYAAQLVAHGLHNPYVYSMGPAGPIFRLSPDAYTYTLTGHAVLQLSYPSLSFLIYVPFILLGWTNEVGAGINVAGWVVSVLLMFWLLPRNLRPAVLVFSSINVYLAFATGGVTDMLFIPLLIVAAYRWDRFGADRRSYVGPVALGLAMAIKQTPWPVIAFVLCALACDQYDRDGDLLGAARRAARYLGVAVAAFLVPNLPYMIASPSAWANGVFVPFVKNLVPAGQGLVSLTLFAHLGGGSLAGYTVIFGAVALLLLVVFVGTYPLLRPATFMLPAIAYFFAARSQTNYLISLIPVALVGAATAGPAVRRAPGAGRRVARILRSRNWGWGAGALALLLLIAAIYTFSSSSPLQLTIVGKQTTGYLGGVHSLEVRVHNRTDKALTPGYTIQTSGGFSAFWNILKGPKTLAPGQTAIVQLTTPNYPAEPGLSAGFSVVAFTDTPAALSISPRSLLDLWRTATLPQAFDKPVPVGKRIVLRVQVLSHFNSAIHRAGIPVYMGQLVYRSFGNRRGSAKINGQPPHKGYVIAYTNDQGTATFYIVGTKPSLVPTTFSAHLWNAAGKYVYGSSGYTNVRFIR